MIRGLMLSLAASPAFAQSFHFNFRKPKAHPIPTTVDRHVERTTLSGVGGEEIELSVVSLEHLTELQAELAASSALSHHVIGKGSNSRAHRMSQILDDKGVLSAKAIIEGDLHLPPPAWWGEAHARVWFHVAPTVLVRLRAADGKPARVPYVVDPSLFGKPVPLSAWRERVTSHPGTRVDRQYLARRFVFVPPAKTGLTAYDPKDDVVMNGEIAQLRDVYSAFDESVARTR